MSNAVFVVKSFRTKFVKKHFSLDFRHVDGVSSVKLCMTSEWQSISYHLFRRWSQFKTLTYFLGILVFQCISVDFIGSVSFTWTNGIWMLSIWQNCLARLPWHLEGVTLQRLQITCNTLRGWYIFLQENASDYLMQMFRPSNCCILFANWQVWPASSDNRKGALRMV